MAKYSIFKEITLEIDPNFPRSHFNRIEKKYSESSPSQIHSFIEMESTSNSNSPLPSSTLSSTSTSSSFLSSDNMDLDDNGLFFFSFYLL